MPITTFTLGTVAFANAYVSFATASAIFFSLHLFAILIPEDVAAGERCFGEIIDKDALLRSKFFKIRHFISKNFDIGKAVYGGVDVVSTIGY